ncbi:MAG: amidohydrolase family protein, partial [Actinobacteria bacterium]|nr:amidohydrolase family protein [Actinomycetota bacterium]
MSARRARAARGVLATTLAAIAAMGGAAAEQPSGAALAIRAARVFTATGLPPIADGVVIVRAGRIVAVGPRASVPIPVEATVVELPNHTVLPGLIDTHSHFLNRYAAGGVLGLEAQRAAPPNVQMVSVVRNARVQFLSGVTTVRQTGEPNYNDILMRDAIAAGTLVGPRVVASGPLITSTGGHGAGEHGLDGEDAFRRAVRERVKRGAEWIKLTQLDVSPDAAQISPTEIRAAIDEAHRLGVKVTVHATGRWGSAIRTAVEAGADNIEHARPLTPALLALMLKRGTTASLTPIVYIGWRPTPRTWQVMDAGVSNAEEWINYMAKEIADYRAAHPANE